MKILIVSWYFPPANTIGAIRIGNLARFLEAQGRETGILTAKNLPYPQTLSLSISSQRVVRTRWYDVNAMPARASRLIKSAVRRMPVGRRHGNVAETGNEAREADAPRDWLKERSWLSALYTHLINFPDAQIGWMPGAVWSGRRLIKGWRPDIIFASGPPFTTLLIAHILSRVARLPLVVEFRDRWSDDPYYPPPPWRRKLDMWLERHIVARSVSVVTVSEPWAEAYRLRYGKPTLVVCNGYDAEEIGAGPFQGSPGKPYLRIVYTGGIYPGRRDPSPLFQALESQNFSPDDVRIEFYGTDPGMVLPIARRYSVSHLVRVYPGVPHDVALRLQCEADILLLMQWDDPKEQGNVPGKFFEYLGARRPILVLGLADGVPASIVQERNAGFYGSTPETIAAQIDSWIATKRASDCIPALPECVRQGYSRDEQFAKLEQFFAELCLRGVN